MPVGSEPASGSESPVGFDGGDTLATVELPLPDPRVGKVRSSWALPGERRLFVTTDRLSAFDQIVAVVPRKGQVLNELAAWWFERTADIIDNHVISLPDPNALIAVAATPLAVEVIVRGVITGVTDTSLWRQYADGARVIYGHRMPDGLRKNEILPTALITPTTKGEAGVHDEPLSVADVVDRGIIGAELWSQVCDAALAVFIRGQKIAADAGLILADTKYEFGIGPDGRLLLIDEVHTPDSSRYWEADSYETRMSAGEEPESLDKEVVRRALAAAGYRGDGPVPTLDAAVWEATSARYRRAFERVTGTSFVPGATPILPRLEANLRSAGVLTQ
jgi:phosphoribosylaminoimidazole-succinocarboxamide synthase